MTFIQVLRRAWSFRRERHGIFEQPGEWRWWHAGCRARATPTLDEIGYPVAMVQECARCFRWVVRDMNAEPLAEGACIDVDTAQAQADEAARAIGRWRLGWTP